jgi:hypothetical protein
LFSCTTYATDPSGEKATPLVEWKPVSAVSDCGDACAGEEKLRQAAAVSAITARALNMRQLSSVLTLLRLLEVQELGTKLPKYPRVKP